jgi:hypothetical protein
VATLLTGVTSSRADELSTTIDMSFAGNLTLVQQKKSDVEIGCGSLGLGPWEEDQHW